MAPTSPQFPDASPSMLQVCRGAIQELETEVKRLNGEIMQLEQERDGLAQENEDLRQEKEQQVQASAYTQQQVHHILPFLQRAGVSIADLQLSLRRSYDQPITTPVPGLHNAPPPTVSQPHANTSGVTWQDPLGYENMDLTMPSTDMGLDFLQS